MGAIQVEFLKSGVVDSSGDPLASGKVYFYEPGTTTAKTVWTDEAQTSAASSPVVLDARGAAEIFAEGLYDIKIDTSADVAVHTYDDQLFTDLAVDEYVTNVSVNNTTAETTIASCDFDGTLLSTTSVMEFFCGFEFVDTGAAGTADLTIRLYVSGDSSEALATATFTNITGHATAKGTGFVRAVIYGDGSTNMVHVEIQGTDNNSNDATSGTPRSVADHYIGSDTFSQTFDGTDSFYVTAQWDAASANYTATSKGAHLRIRY